MASTAIPAYQKKYTNVYLDQNEMIFLQKRERKGRPPLFQDNMGVNTARVFQGYDGQFYLPMGEQESATPST